MVPEELGDRCRTDRHAGVCPRLRVRAVRTHPPARRGDQQTTIAALEAVRGQRIICDAPDSVIGHALIPIRAGEWVDGHAAIDVALAFVENLYLVWRERGGDLLFHGGD